MGTCQCKTAARRCLRAVPTKVPFERRFRQLAGANEAACDCMRLSWVYGGGTCAEDLQDLGDDGLHMAHGSWLAVAKTPASHADNREVQAQTADLQLLHDLDVQQRPTASYCVLLRPTASYCALLLQRCKNVITRCIDSVAPSHAGTCWIVCTLTADHRDKFAPARVQVYKKPQIVIQCEHSAVCSFVHGMPRRQNKQGPLPKTHTSRRTSAPCRAKVSQSVLLWWSNGPATEAMRVQPVKDLVDDAALPALRSHVETHSPTTSFA